MRQNLMVAVGLIIFLTACYPAHIYERSNIPKYLVAKNAASCWQKASVLIDREISLDQSYDRTGGHSLEVSFARFDAHKQRNLFFIDSLTSRNSIAYHVAKAYHIPTARNQVFLDNSKKTSEIKKQIRLLTKIAMRHGVAIGIGHARSSTAHAIWESLPMLQEQGIELVFASQVVR